MSQQRFLILAAVITLVTACATPEASPTTGPSSIAATGAPSPSTVVPEVTAAPSTFTSEKYGYSIALPAGWFGHQAFLQWDGTRSPGHDAAEVDQFHSSTGTDAWAMAAPTTKDLATFWTDQLAAAAVAHPCASTIEVEVDEQITIDGLPAHLTVLNCPGPGGIRVGGAGVVKAGTGYIFYLQHPQNDTADPSDMTIFRTLLSGVALP